MADFYVTFGQKYRGEKHPFGGHPDGYFRVAAFDIAEARDFIILCVGMQWSNIYAAPPEKKYAPYGELAVLDENGLTLTEKGKELCRTKK